MQSPFKPPHADEESGMLLDALQRSPNALLQLLMLKAENQSKWYCRFAKKSVYIQMHEISLGFLSLIIKNAVVKEKKRKNDGIFQGQGSRSTV